MLFLLLEMGAQGCDVLPRLSLLVLMHFLLLLLSAGPHGCVTAARVVERLNDGFDYSYKITDYALGDTADYHLAPVITSGK